MRPSAPENETEAVSCGTGDFVFVSTIVLRIVFLDDFVFVPFLARIRLFFVLVAVVFVSKIPPFGLRIPYPF